MPVTIPKECGNVDLDSKIGSGTHYVCYQNIDYCCEDFDSFGLQIQTDLHRYLLNSGKEIMYSGDEIPERDCVSCGYWCLYYLLKRH